MLTVMALESDTQESAHAQLRRIGVYDLGPPPGALGQLGDAQDGAVGLPGGIGLAVRDGPADEGRAARSSRDVRGGVRAAGPVLVRGLKCLPC